MAEHSTVNRRVTGSSPVGGAHKARTPEASPRGFLLYLLPWLEPVTTPPYVSAGALPPGPRAYALGGITVFTSSRARKNRHPAVSSPEQQRIAGGGDKDAPPRKIVKSNAQKSSPRPHAPHPHPERSGGAPLRCPLTPTPEQIHRRNQAQNATPAAQYRGQKVENT